MPGKASDYEEENDPAKPEREYWKYLETKLANLKDEVECSLFAMEYGKDYALYKWGRKYHLKGKYRKALGYYNRILDEFLFSPLADAAQCYKIDCLLKNPGGASFSEIKKEAFDFIKNKPYGLYRGETAAFIGRHILEEYLDIKEAEKYYSKAYDFCERSRKLNENKLLFSLKDNVKQIGVVDLPFEGYTKTYCLIRRKVGSSEIINRETNKYYIDHLQKECAFALGFIKFSQGKKEEASKLFHEVGRFDKQMLGIDAKNMPNALARLRGACIQGFFYLNWDELKYFKGKDRTKILLADFYFALEKNPQAMKIYSNMFFTAEKEQKVCLLLRIASIQTLNFESAEAEKSYLEALKLSKKMKTPFFHTLHDMGCFYSSQGKKAEAYEYLKKAALKGKKTYYGRLAHYRLFNEMGMRGDMIGAKREYSKFCVIYEELFSQATLDRLRKIAERTNQIVKTEE